MGKREFEFRANFGYENHLRRRQFVLFRGWVACQNKRVHNWPSTRNAPNFNLAALPENFPVSKGRTKNSTRAFVPSHCSLCLCLNAAAGEAILQLNFSAGNTCERSKKVQDHFSRGMSASFL